MNKRSIYKSVNDKNKKKMGKKNKGIMYKKRIEIIWEI
jgi:hypothetical protein